MKGIPRLEPTPENTYILAYPGDEEYINPDYDFDAILKASRAFEREGDVKQACDMRYAAFRRLHDLIPENEETVLDWDDEDNQAALELTYASAIDHFLLGDFELAAGMLELLLDTDPEDHLDATQPLAYCYVELGEDELFDEIIDDISDKYPEKAILKMWSEFNRTGEIPQGEIIRFKKIFPQYHKEFTSDSHEITPEFKTDLESEHPSRETQARELWLKTEHIWNKHPEYIETLKKNHKIN